MKLLQKFASFSFYTLLSRILGYIRDMLLAISLGTGILNDAFIIALRLPNLFRSIFAEGALNNAFIPLYSSTKSKEEALNFASGVRNILALFLLIITILFEFLMPYIISIMAPGIKENPEMFSLTVNLSRITFPYLFFIAIVALYGGILNSMGQFMPFASAPLLFNLAMILFIFIKQPFDSIAHASSYAVLTAGVLELLWMSFFLYFHKTKLPLGSFKIDDKIKQMLLRMLPIIFSASTVQINLLIDTIFASLEAGAISYLYYANRISQLPLALIGISIGTVILPSLSRYFVKDSQKAIQLQTQAINISLLLCIPASMALIFFAHETVFLLLQGGKFDIDSTASTAVALIAYGIGLPAWVFLKIMIANFHSRGNTKFTFKVSLLGMFTSIALNGLLFFVIGFVGIAIASSIAAYMMLITFVIYAIKQGHLKFARSNIIVLLKSITSSAIMLIIIQNILSFYGTNKYSVACAFGLGLMFYLTTCIIFNLIYKKKSGILIFQTKLE